VQTIECRAVLPIADGQQTISIDVHLSVPPEVWLSIANIIGGQVTRQSAVWRTSGWRTIIGDPTFAPASVLRQALHARPWDKELPEDTSQAALSVIHIAAGLDQR